MKTKIAQEEVENFGDSYFYDELDRNTVKQIINRKLSEISQTFKISGLKYPEKTCEALFTITKQYNTEMLDQILYRSFGLSPDDVGGSYNFFYSLALKMDEEIKKTRKKLLEQNK